MKPKYKFFKTTMPQTRKADYYLGYFEGSVFIDFNQSIDNLISLVRISFDGYGCCTLNDKSVSLNHENSQKFIEEIQKDNLDQEKITELVKKLVKINKDYIWIDALEEYELIE